MKIKFNRNADEFRIYDAEGSLLATFDPFQNILFDVENVSEIEGERKKEVLRRFTPAIMKWERRAAFAVGGWE